MHSSPSKSSMPINNFLRFPNTSDIKHLTSNIHPMMQKKLFTISATLLTFFCFLTAAFAEATLTHDGNPTSIIILPPNPDKTETAAAAELQTHIQLISGAKLDIATLTDGQSPKEAAQGKTPILLARPPQHKIPTYAHPSSKDASAFTLSVTSDAVTITGNQSPGTLIGAYELLEQLGVRWFMPGELGRVIPSAKTITLKDQSIAQAPAFSARWAAPLDATWQQRNRMGGHYFAGAHGIAPFAGSAEQRNKQLAADPELFALKKKTGKRVISQVCVSNPKVLAAVIQNTKEYFRKNPNSASIAMGPNDGSNFCECDNCRALDADDWDAFSNELSVTDRYIWFYNQVLKGIEDEFPDKKIETYIYHCYAKPPVKVVPDRRIRGALAPIALCRVHGPTNPICPEKSYYLWMASAWGKLLPEVFDRGYWFNLADPGFPFLMVGRIREEIPAAKKAGVTGWRVEAVGHWASENPSLYIAARLMWHDQANVDALMQDFFDKFYGPASKPMGQYTLLMDNALTNSDFHTGSSFDMPNFYPAPLRQKARALLDEAARLAPADSLYAKRVLLTTKSFNYVDAFIAMIDLRNRHDYVAAYAELEKIDAIRTDLTKNYDIPMLNLKLAESYLKRFFRTPTEQGYKRVTGGNEFVAGLNDQWSFSLDPQGMGEFMGLERPDLTGANWQNILTSSKSWSDQGLRYYKGEAWYKQTIEIPAKFAGKRIFLWVGGVDEKAKVFLNGKSIGISGGGAFVPFEVDATDAIQPGKQNTVAIRISNTTVNELGTGGITAPVMFYAPKDGKDAKLENIRVLGSTFP